LDNAQRDHEARAESLDAERAKIEKRIEAEDDRWESKKQSSRRLCAVRGNNRQARVEISGAVALTCLTVRPRSEAAA